MDFINQKKFVLFEKWSNNNQVESTRFMQWFPFCCYWYGTDYVIVMAVKFIIHGKIVLVFIHVVFAEGKLEDSPIS